MTPRNLSSFRRRIAGPHPQTALLSAGAVLFGLQATPHPAAGDMITGRYVGNGTTQVVSGLGFAPAVVIVKGNVNKDAVVRTSAMPADSSKPLVGNAALKPDRITSLGADGFTVGSDHEVNRSGTDYYWVAFEEAAGVLKTGAYTGDGTADRVVAGIGFRPEFIAVMAASAVEAVFRLPVTIPSFDFDKSPGEANLLTTPVLDDGFRVGSDSRVNQNGVRYYYVCWNEIPGYQDFGGYTGDGTDNRNVTLPGFKPEYLIVRNSQGEDTAQRPASLGDAADETAFFNTMQNAANRIQALLPNGFQVGSDKAVNKGGDYIMYAAFAAQRTFSISGVVFEDADFAGTASDYDGGSNDLALANVDVELYDAGAGDAFLATTTTDASGAYSFGGLPAGDYKVRARSATIGDADTPPAGALNACVPATCPYPLADMTWGSGTPAYGGQDPDDDDTNTGDDAGPGDTYVSVTIGGADRTDVNLGFAYNLIVNTLDDMNVAAVRSRQGSLRQFLKNALAIGAAGATTANRAQFRLPLPPNQSNGGDGWWRIAPVAALPAISDGGTILDGSTQTINVGDVNTRGPEVEIYGSGAGDVNGLVVSSAGNEIRGLILNGFDRAARAAVRLTSAAASHNVVAGNYIGTDHAGAAAIPNTYGVSIVDYCRSNTIGGTTAADRNLVSGNVVGIGLSGTSGKDVAGNVVIGNYIGTNAAGAAAIPNFLGVHFDPGSDSTRIGGTSAAERNLVSGNTYGIFIAGISTTHNSVQGNYVGTDAAGSAAVGNGTGVVIQNSSTSNTIGGPTAAHRNVISGNTYGIQLRSNLNTVLGNFIGTDAAGAAPLGNTINGIRFDLSAASNVVGGVAAGQANVIAHSGSDGIHHAGTGAGNVFSGNSVYSNGGLGIRLDAGANADKAAPTLVSVAPSGGNYGVAATGAAGDTLEFFRVGNASSPAVSADPSGAGEGYLYLGRCADNGSCAGPHMSAAPDGDPTPGAVRGTFLASALAPGALVTATATAPADGTSPFAGNQAVPVLEIVKRATALDGTPLPDGATLAAGTRIKFLLYINNPGPAAADVSLRDVLDPAFAYQPGTIRFDNSRSSCALPQCDAAEEAAIFAAVDAGTIGTDAADADPVSATGVTIDAGDQSAGNARLDIAADRVWAMVFTVKID